MAPARHDAAYLPLFVAVAFTPANRGGCRSGAPCWAVFAPPVLLSGLLTELAWSSYLAPRPNRCCAAAGLRPASQPVVYGGWALAWPLLSRHGISR
jgi:hypothetical protein